MQNAFVMEDAVAEIADVFPAPVELRLVLLLRGSVGEGVFSQVRTDTSSSMTVVEKACPKAEIEFRNDASGRSRFPKLEETILGLIDSILLPSGKLGTGLVIPSISSTTDGECVVNFVPEGDFRKLQGRI